MELRYPLFIAQFNACVFQRVHCPVLQLRYTLFLFSFQSDPSTAFLRAARAGQLEKVLEYLESGVDINASNAVSFSRNFCFNYCIINYFTGVECLIGWRDV